MEKNKTFPKYHEMTDEEILEYVKNKNSGPSPSAPEPKPEEPLKPFDSDEERIQAKREILQELQALNDLAAREEGTSSSRMTPIKGIQRGSEQVMEEDFKLWGMDGPLAKTSAKVIIGTGNVRGATPAIAAIATKNVISGDDYDATERLKALGRGFIDPTAVDTPTGFASEIADPESRVGQAVGLLADIALGGALSSGTLARAGKALSTVGRIGVTAAKTIPQAATKAGQTAVKAGQAAVKAKDTLKNLDVKASAKDFITKGKTYLEESKAIKNYKASVKDEVELAQKQFDEFKNLEKKLGVLDSTQQNEFAKARLNLENVLNKQKVTDKLSDRELLNYINIKKQIDEIENLPDISKRSSEELQELASKQNALKMQVKNIENAILAPPKKQTLTDVLESREADARGLAIFNQRQAKKAAKAAEAEKAAKAAEAEKAAKAAAQAEEAFMRSFFRDAILKQSPKQMVIDSEAAILGQDLPIKLSKVLDSKNFTKPSLKNRQRSLKKAGVLGPDLPLEDATKAVQDLIESGQAGGTPKLETVIKRMQALQEGKAGKDLSLEKSINSIKSLKKELKTKLPTPAEMEIAKDLQSDIKALEKAQTSQAAPAITAAPVTPSKGPKTVLETPKTTTLVASKAKPHKTKQERKAEIKTVVEQKVKNLPPKEKIKAVKSMAVQDFFDRQDTVVKTLRTNFISALQDIIDKISAKREKLGLPIDQMDNLDNLLNTISRSVAGKQGYHVSTQYNMLEKVADNVKLSPEARQALQAFIDANKQKETLEQISIGLKNAAIDLFERFNNQIKKENPLLEPFQDDIKTLMETMDGFSKQFNAVAKYVASKSPEAPSKEILLKQYPELNTVMNKSALNILKKQDQDVIAATEMGKGRYSSKITSASAETKRQLVGPKEEPPKKVIKKQEAKSTPKKEIKQESKIVEEKVKTSLPAKKTESNPKQTATNKPKEPVKTTPKLSKALKESISRQIIEIEEELATPGLKEAQEISLKEELKTLKTMLKD